MVRGFSVTKVPRQFVKNGIVKATTLRRSDLVRRAAMLIMSPIGQIEDLSKPCLRLRKHYVSH